VHKYRSINFKDQILKTRLIDINYTMRNILFLVAITSGICMRISLLNRNTQERRRRHFVIRTRVTTLFNVQVIQWHVDLLRCDGEFRKVKHIYGWVGYRFEFARRLHVATHSISVSSFSLATLSIALLTMLLRGAVEISFRLTLWRARKQLTMS